MPVQIFPSPIAARAFKPDSKTKTKLDDILEGASPREGARSKEIHHSSLKADSLDTNSITASQNGLVYGLIAAYSGHHHISIRPEDVWLAILTQLSFYINAHAEDLRPIFIAHAGKMHLDVTEYGTLQTVDVGVLAQRLAQKCQNNIKDPGLKDWVMPNFSTTTHDDLVVASVTMMGMLQKYFTYGMSTKCGIPSVTLLGIREDWVLIAGRLLKLDMFGKEPQQFRKMLEPVLKRFVATFDHPTCGKTLDFWNRAAREEHPGSGEPFLTGWLNAFCLWNEDGKLLNGRIPFGNRGGITLDGIQFHDINMEDIPAGSSSIFVKFNDNGELHNMRMLAGSIAIRSWSTGEKLDKSKAHQSVRPFNKDVTGPEKRDCGTAEPGIDSIAPVLGWFMYEVDSDDEVEARKQRLTALKRQLDAMGSEWFIDEEGRRIWDEMEKLKLILD